MLFRCKVHWPKDLVPDSAKPVVASCVWFTTLLSDFNCGRGSIWLSASKFGGSSALSKIALKLGGLLILFVSCGLPRKNSLW